ncbi:PAS domain-containing sensor histidine kinase [uncultured Thiohalocapsa sp.]|uniref:PAS domain-containing sensor histidine kinase n=1 Tax=uncultured Thiohalocapsa sp. TaxID=768990 RepID=UPI0025F23E7C|nr:PAS domain-containing sensor histidine kinase [uncultured Thiohalocapsa sp.]
MTTLCGSKRGTAAFRQLLDAIPSSVLLVDEALHITCVNRNFLAKSQLSETQTIGRRLADVFPTVILERTDMAARIRNVFRDGQPVRGQRITYRAPGIPLRIYYYSVVPLGGPKGTETVMLFLEDVTEQVRLSEEVRRVERHLASVVESASDMVLSVDTEGRILTWNSAAEALSGLTAVDVRGRYLWEICEAPAQWDSRRVLLQTLTAGNGPRTCECRLVPSGCEPILVSWLFSPMKDDHGAIIGAVAVGRDLTERRKLEHQLRQSHKLAALGVMAGGIAHEVRNPLAVCSSAAQFLMEDDLPADFRRECAEKIQNGMRKASDIIENLLRFARPSAQEDMTELDLVAVLRETLTLIENQARVQKIRVRQHLPEQPVLVRGVSSLLQQVFMNLALNAIKAMPDGGDLTVDLFVADGEVWVAVADTGVGISEGELERIFDPFHTGSSPGWGTGLGLSISYSIVQRHLGSISVESRVDEGSRFSVRLPLL